MPHGESRRAGASLTARWARRELAPLGAFVQQLVAADFAVERGALDAQQGGGLAFVPAGGNQGRQDVLPLDIRNELKNNTTPAPKVQPSAFVKRALYFFLNS